LEEVGAVALDLGACPFVVGGAAFQLGEGGVAFL
jgi:hypothetical protein